MMAPLAFYWIAGSTPCRRVQVVLEEKLAGQYTSHLLEVSKGQLRTPDFLALNERGQVPVLTDGDRLIKESLATIMYLEDAYPEKSLVPKDLDARARMYQRMMEAGTLLDTSRAAFWMKGKDLIKNADDEAKFLENCRKLKAELDRWEGYLTDDYLAGSEFTLADAACAPNFGQLKRLGVDMTKFPRLNAYLDRMEERPSFIASYPPHWKGTEGKDWLAPVTLS